MSNFILSCGSTVDLPYSELEARDIRVIFYSYMINGEEFTDDMGRDPNAIHEFYDRVRQGALPTTSQINIHSYYNYFRELLLQGDVLHIAFTSGMSGAAHNAIHAAELLREQFSHRRIIVIDSTCASAGYGLLVSTAADMRDNGCSIDEVAQWVRDNKHNVHQQFFSTDLTHFRRSGRVSGAAAAVGTLLGICPLMHVDYDGKIVAYDKVRGKANAISRTAEWMERHALGGSDYDLGCFINHSECPELAESLRDLLEQKFPKLKGKIKIYTIGTIIGSHSGPGTVSLYFYGDERPSYQSEQKLAARG